MCRKAQLNTTEQNHFQSILLPFVIPLQLILRHVINWDLNEVL